MITLVCYVLAAYWDVPSQWLLVYARPSVSLGTRYDNVDNEEF
jgi:hypothetical protein